MSVIAEAKSHILKGRCIVPIKYRSKSPVIDEWQDLRITVEDLPKHFNGKKQNLGIHCGEPSNGLVDVDLDCPEAKAAADVFLPETDLRSGRLSSPDSHRWYRAVANIPQSVRRFQDVTDPTTNKRATIAELRSTGGQTVIPPSEHPNGEAYTWSAEGEPTEVDGADLLRRVSLLCSTALVARHWPQEGARHDCALALAGALATFGLTQQEAHALILTAARIAGDREAEDRGKTVETTYRNIAAGKACTGIPTLKQFLGEPVVSKLSDWLGKPHYTAETVNGEEKREEKPKSTAQRLVEIGREAELIRSDRDEGFAVIHVADHQEVWPLRHKVFRDWLARQYHRETGRPAGSQAMEDALRALDGYARFDGAEHTLYVRVAPGEDGSILYDLADRNWRTIRITRDGVTLLTQIPPTFRRYAVAAQQREPAPSGDINELRRFLNAQDDSAWYQLVAWIVAAFFYDIAHPVLVVHGEQGSAKSTLMRLLSMLIDPSRTPLRTEPRDVGEWVQAADHAWLITLDNVSRLPSHLSDSLCRAVTGEGFSKRALYTDADDVIICFRRVVALTGIEVVAQRADLLDRSILLGLDPIEPAKRRPESAVLVEFEEKRPVILAGLLDTVSKVLRELPSVQLTEYPRMADFARVGVAVERVMGWPGGAFLRAYSSNIAAQHEEALSAAAIGEAIQALMDRDLNWEGTSKQLLTALEGIVPEKATKQSEWPKNPRALSGQVRRIAQNLRGTGIQVAFSRDRKGRIIRMARTSAENTDTTVTPSRACSREGCSIDVKVEPLTQTGLRATQPAEPDHAWIDRDDGVDASSRPYSDGECWEEY